MKNLLLYLSLFLISVLAVLHITAIENYFYWTYAWFDILTHFLGGLWLSVTVVWLFKEKFYLKTKVFWLSFFSVLIISLFWEIFELIIWQSLEEPGYLFDTILDTIMALSGASIVSLFLRPRYDE